MVFETNYKCCYRMLDGNLLGSQRQLVQNTMLQPLKAQMVRQNNHDSDRTLFLEACYWYLYGSSFRWLYRNRYQLDLWFNFHVGIYVRMSRQDYCSWIHHGWRLLSTWLMESAWFLHCNHFTHWLLPEERWPAFHQDLASTAYSPSTTCHLT